MIHSGKLKGHQPGTSAFEIEMCKTMTSVRDALEIISGKWKIPILVSLADGDKRFTQIGQQVNGITDKMLSRELKFLEYNKLVKKTLFDTFPPTSEYSLTHHGKSLQKLVNELVEWGRLHREEIINNKLR